MSIFDTLAEQHVKVQYGEKEPFQWIYAVDDAWFQPDGWNLKIAKDGNQGTRNECPPLFDKELIGKTVQLPEGFGNSDDYLVAGNTPSNGLTMGGGRGSQNADEETLLKNINRNGWHNSDDDTARRLCKFIAKQSREHNRSYGVCFCSFEFFWKQIAEINRPQNAVLFDIRHQLAAENSEVEKGRDQSALRDDWKVKLRTLALFDPREAGFEMSRLGWYLHYAFKFGRIPEMQNEVKVRGDHVVIVSSAINPQSAQEGSPAPRPDPMSDFTQVQSEMWRAVAAEGASDRFTPERFKFWPLPKSHALDNGLAFFNNSFKHASDWQFKREQLITDMLYLWERHDLGHLNGKEVRNQPSLHCSHWISGTDDSAYRECLRGFHFLWEHPNQRKGFSVDSLLSFFDEAFCKRLELTERNGIDKVLLPTSPGGCFLITIADVYWALMNCDGNDQHKQPEPSVASDGRRITLGFTITDAGVTCLAKIANENDAPRKGASVAIWNAVRGSVFLLDKLAEDQKTKQYRTNSGSTWESVLSATPSAGLPVCFCKDTLKFHFLKDTS